MIKSLRFACAITLAATFVPASAQSLVSLQPSSDWAVANMGDQCVLAREFSNGDDNVQLSLRSYEPAARFYVQLTGTLAQTSSTAERIRLVFGAVEFHDPTFVTGMVQGNPTFMLKPIFSLGPLSDEAKQRMEENLPVSSYAEPAYEATIDEIRFLDGLEQEIALETGSLGAPMEALRNCSRQLTQDWAVTSEDHMQLSRIALPSSSFRWLGSRNFQRRLAQGSHWSMRLIVDEGGKVSDCRLSGANSESDAQKACKIAEDKARFEPALDSEGNPASDYWLLTVQP